VVAGRIVGIDLDFCQQKYFVGKELYVRDIRIYPGEQPGPE
jgi:hypothetical protein